MTNAMDHWLPGLPGLPDPARDPAFYAGVPARRFAAWAIDALIVAAACVVVVPVFGILTLGLGFFLAPLVFALLSFFYRVATLSAASATWGMRLMGVELRAANGERLDFGLAFAHVGLYTLSLFLAVPIFLSGLTVLSTRYGQTLHDIVLRTAAINRPEE